MSFVRNFSLKSFFVYILANRKDGTLYTGVTSDIARRVYEHKTKSTGGFSARYHVDRLVYLEGHDNAPHAIAREKKLKRWCWKWKIELIEADNPDWRDLFDDVMK